MAEPASTAFGRYLRILRERKGYSLDEVADLSRTFADPVDKAYLSRCENGRLKIAFSKVIALSRIYEVPAEVLLERLELDLEAEQIASALVTDRSLQELVHTGTEYHRRGSHWEAYVIFRDAIRFAGAEPLIEGFESLNEQLLCAFMNCSTAARFLGRLGFTSHELRFVERHQSALSDEYRATLYSNLTAVLRSMGQVSDAVAFADRAIALLREVPSQRYLGGAYLNRANLAAQQGEFDKAVELYKLADKTLAANGRSSERPTVLLNIAQTYLSTGRLSAASKALASALRIAEQLGQQRPVAQARLLEGDLELRAGRPHVAERKWRDTISIARGLRDRALKFQAEFRLFRTALDSGELDRARLIQRRIDRSIAWLPNGIDELTEFKSLRIPVSSREHESS